MAGLVYGILKIPHRADRSDAKLCETSIFLIELRRALRAAAVDGNR